MSNVLKDLLARRRYLDAEYFDILARYAYCEPHELSLMQTELEGNRAFMSVINEKINDNQEIIK